jgi:predicted lipoprotein with Yx(FWY)xxD motif
MGYGCDTAAPSSGPTAAPSQQGNVVVITQSSGAEPHFLGPSGKALYVFDNDSPTQSACGAGCTDTWPPLIVAPGYSVQAGGHESDFGTLTRDDGSLQLTFDHRPLYYYSGDASASDTNGDGLFGVWHLVHP